MTYNKQDIDISAEREAKAINKQGYDNTQQHRRRNIKKNYNRVLFNKLFKE